MSGQPSRYRDSVLDVPVGVERSALARHDVPLVMRPRDQRNPLVKDRPLDWREPCTARQQTTMALLGIEVAARTIGEAARLINRAYGEVREREGAPLFTAPKAT